MNFFKSIASSRRRGGGGGPSYESEIVTWAAAIATAGGSLSTNNKDAWNAVVAGAKAAGYWSSVKVLVPLAGPNQAGCLVPIVGAAPTSVGTFTSHTTAGGLQGNASTAYLDSNVPCNSGTVFGGQNDFWFGCYVTTAPSTTGRAVMADTLAAGSKAIWDVSGTQWRFYIGAASGTNSIALTTTTFTGILSQKRSGSTTTTVRAGATTQTPTNASGTPTTGNMTVFASGGSAFFSNARIGCYFMGLSSADEAHWKGLLDTCFAALT